MVCIVCQHPRDLSLCSRCRMVEYCGQTCQKKHFPVHKTICKAIMSARERLQREEADLRNRPADIFLPADVFTNSVGHFWGLTETRDYMTARSALIQKLDQMNTERSLNAALENILDCLRLNRSDNLGLRSPAVSIMLRLGKLQECYDFVKWWRQAGEDSHYDWGDTDLPFMDIRNANMFEPVGFFFNNKLGDLYHKAAVSLIKILLVFALCDEWHVDRLFRNKPLLVRDGIKRHLPYHQFIPSSTVVSFKMMNELREQVVASFKGVKSQNPHFWPFFRNPTHTLSQRDPEYMSPGDPDEALIAFKSMYLAFERYPKSLAVVEKLS
ncbi:hypothetical protein BJ742DRAFT_803081 [Cladochytrium replicatum]|nr:hypothetical protein BJ742DRAFT_803081 [Cladochytrium replicatum]